MSRTLTFLVAVSLAVAARAAEPPPAPPSLRLPESVRPLRGAIALDIVPGRPTFSGSVDFDVQLAAPASVVWLNQHELTIRDASVTVAGKPLRARATTSGDYVAVVPERPLAAGRARVHLDFSGNVSDAQIVGLFHVKDRGHDIVVSKFESIFARRAFPCFDEPSFKIPWQMTLHVRKSDAAFSNTPMQAEHDEANGMKRVVFAETPPLPSYLVALAVGALEHVDVGRAGRNHVPVGLVVPVGHAGETAWPREIAPQIVDRLERYFDVPFPYPKLDLLIVPQYPGGMEDAGLILLGSSGLLGDLSRLSVGDKRNAAHVLMHEVAHMWFGDLVTSAWWNDIWLNEAFASWIDGKLVDEWQPSWKAIEGVANARAYAFRADALASARRIRQPIETADDILNAFDAITYQKGETVLAMLERWLGADVFRRGVHDYLVAHANRAATSSDFVAAMTKSAGGHIDVAPVFASFTDQAGIPALQVGLRCNAGAAPVVTLEQHRFVPAGGQAADGLWQLPVCVRVPGEPTRSCTVLRERTAELTLPDKSCPSALLANDEEAGYYLALYPPSLLQKLLGERARLSMRERLGLVHDLSRLLDTGRAPAADALHLLDSFAGDGEPSVARAALAGLTTAGMHLVAPAQRAGWRRFIVASLGARARTLGWKPAANEPDDVRLLRPRILSLAAVDGEEPQLVAAGAALARRWLDDRAALDPDVRNVGLLVAARHGDAALWDRLHAELAKETDPTARTAMIRALVGFADASLRQKSFDFVLSPEVNGRETYDAYFAVAAGDPEAQAIRLAFVEARYDQILARFPPNRAGDLIEALAQCDGDGRKRLAGFFATRAAKMTGGPRALAHALEASDQCIAARAAAAPSLSSLLK